jgi:hypothetical protein
MNDMNGIDLIVAERKRQIEKEKFDSTHDSQHESKELAWAAVCYAAPEPIYRCELPFGPRAGYTFTDPWPDWWDPEWDKREKHSDIRRLVIAGALIAAEIDRLLNEELKS